MRLSFGPKSTRLEKFGEKKILSPKHFENFWVKNDMSKKISVQKMSDSKKFWVQMILGPKSFGSKEIWSLKKFGSKNLAKNGIVI